MSEDGFGGVLAGMPPGPDLARVLAPVVWPAVPNDDVVDVLAAQQRQLNHEQALTWAAIDEVIHRRPCAPPGQVRRGVDPFLDGADEIRAALSLTRRAADVEADLAHTLVCGLPLMWQAVYDGHLDRGRARVFTRHLPPLSGGQIRAICEALLPVAAGLTTGQLEERLIRMVLEIDPEYYAARYRTALRDRKLVHYLDEAGAAVVCATGLPAEEAAAAMVRVDRLARAARRAGYPGTVDQARADTLLALLDGSVHGLSRPEIIDALVSRHAGGHPDPGPGPDDTSPDGSGPDSSGPDGGGPDGGGPDGGGPDGGGLDGSGGGSATVGDQREGIEIRVPLTTLLGRTNGPGSCPGGGRSPPPPPAGSSRRPGTRSGGGPSATRAGGC